MKFGFLYKNAQIVSILQFFRIIMRHKWGFPKLSHTYYIVSLNLSLSVPLSPSFPLSLSLSLSPSFSLPRAQCQYAVLNA